jgi:hypothetical protein
MMRASKAMLLVAGALFAVCCLLICIALQGEALLPGSKWQVHDGKRPQPEVITPGKTFGEPPSDAVVLFDGTSLAKWRSSRGGEAKWKVENGYMEIVPGSGDIETVEQFGDCQLHIEWCIPEDVKGSGQGRGNSGVFLMGRYEIQVLDSFKNTTYADGMAGAIYGQYPPIVNAAREPGQWQTYDIIWLAPRFDEKGKLIRPAYLTLLWNGVVVHYHTPLLGPTRHGGVARYSPHPPVGPLRLQDHGMRVRFRNIWYRPLKGYDGEKEWKPAIYTTGEG